MAAGAAGAGLLTNLLEGCIPAADATIERRPYHRNCSCALHNSAARCRHRSRYDKVSYPIRRSWSEGSLLLIGNPTQSPPSSSASAELPRTPSQLALFKAEEDGASPISKLQL